MHTKRTVAANGGNIQHTLEHGVETATAAAHDSIDSVSHAARPALDHLVAGAHGAVDRAGVAATHAAGTLGVKGDQLNDSSQRIIERAGSYVRENPVVSLGIAVAAGYFLSRLLSSR
jgi:ElaB/YqjD/DUF883 family membrane-anchored ribosome-binding protein